MRELLFRGQTRRKGEKVRLDGTPIDSNWVYGGVAQLNEERAMIYQTEPNFQKFAVYADTVGQYTGLTDNNGKKIFEGDIIKFEACGGDSYSKIGVVTFEDGCYGIKFNNYQCFHRIGEVITDYNRDIYFKYFVIGNIYDNGELLKGEL